MFQDQKNQAENRQENIAEDHGEVLMTWQFPEHPKHEYTRSWKIWMSVLGGGLLVYSLLTVNWLFAVIIVMTVLISLLHSYYAGAEIVFSIMEDGLELGKHFYEYKRVKKFWIIYEPPLVKKLFFEFKSSLKPDLIVPLENINPLKVRDILLKYLVEDLEKEEEPVSEAIGRWLKL